MKTSIPVENGGALTAMRKFFARLLEDGLVDAIYLPLETEGVAVLPALVTDPARLQQANPLAPVMPINGARAVSAITDKQAPARLAAVLRPCEIRALIELVKLQQATLEGLTVIGIDCPGTYELPRFVAWRQENGDGRADYLAAARDGIDPSLAGLDLRPACRMCVSPIPANAAVHIELFGVDTGQSLPLRIPDDWAGPLGLAEGPEPDGRQAALDCLLAAHRQRRDQEMAAMQARLAAEGGLASLLATCIRCHNCMTACPICYCKVCLFRSTSFDHPPEHYLNAARRKGATRLLSDAVLFHLTRLNHMSTSCVNCGMCTSACPAEIPVGMIFSTVASQVQATFDYQPGRSLEEPLPLVTYRENEWTEVGEAK